MEPSLPKIGSSPALHRGAVVRPRIGRSAVRPSLFGRPTGMLFLARAVQPRPLPGVAKQLDRADA
jgi:hypothetical protein